MERIVSDALIYKITKYADNSAIASAYSYGYGKLKLFLPKAYTNRAGIQTFIPGELDFLKKDTSDLNKFYSFRVDTSYVEYLTTPAITLRLSLYFDVFDKLYDIDQPDSVIWKIITKYKTAEYSKINIFGIYALLKNSGHMFHFSTCANCGAEIKEQGSLYMGQYFCEKCNMENSYTPKPYVNTIMQAFSNQELYQRLKINVYDELAVLDLFVKHIEDITEKELKSYKLFKDLILTI